jgi:hypothetical protein
VLASHKTGVIHLNSLRTVPRHSSL